MRRNIWRKAGIGLVSLLVLAQVVPYGRDHSNPPATREPAWDSPTTRALAKRACFDCHSNETHWPWYAHVAPVSWLVQADVDEGRDELNFSEWTRGYKEADESAKTVRGREMPPRIYVLMHPDAKLTDAERDQLAAGLDATLGMTRSTARD